MVTSEDVDSVMSLIFQFRAFKLGVKISDGPQAYVPKARALSRLVAGPLREAALDILGDEFSRHLNERLALGAKASAQGYTFFLGPDDTFVLRDKNDRVLKKMPMLSPSELAISLGVPSDDEDKMALAELVIAAPEFFLSLNFSSILDGILA